MATRGKRLSYSISYKLQVLDYAKEHGSRAAALGKMDSALFLALHTVGFT